MLEHRRQVDVTFDAMGDHDIVQSFKSNIGSNLKDSYTQVHVLLMAWEEHDLGDVDGEIRDLRAIFEQDYRYSSVVFFPIPTKGSSRARLNREISSFVEVISATPLSLKARNRSRNLPATPVYPISIGSITLYIPVEPVL